MSIKIYNFKIILFNTGARALALGQQAIFFYSGGAEEGAQWGKCPTSPWHLKCLEQRSNAIKSGGTPQSTARNQLNNNFSYKCFISAYYVGVGQSTTLSITPPLTDSRRLKLTTKNSLLTVFAKYAFIRTGSSKSHVTTRQLAI